jgi:hypothetical protein
MINDKLRPQFNAMKSLLLFSLIACIGCACAGRKSFQAPQAMSTSSSQALESPSVTLTNGVSALRSREDRETLVKVAIFEAWLKSSFNPFIPTYVSQDLLAEHKRFGLFDRTERKRNEPGLELEISDVAITGNKAKARLSTLKRTKNGRVILELHDYDLENDGSQWAVTKITFAGAS